LWEAVKRAIQQNERFLLCTHRDPDADGVGAELALYRALEMMGKKPVILNPDSLPKILRFMDPEGLVTGFDSLEATEAKRLLDEAQTIFFLDANEWTRLAELGVEVEARSGKVLTIDHHPIETSLTPGSVAKEEASSTGELIYDLLSEIERPIDDRIAYCLYCAIVKDTGCFRFENTNSRVLKIASHLAEFDIVPCEIYDMLFERMSISSMHCLDYVLGTLRFAYDNRLAYIHLTRQMLEQTDALVEETENFVNLIRSIDPVQVCFYFRELPEGKVKISFRSKSNRIDVNKLAEKFNGGGHRRASGAQVVGELESVIEKVVDSAECLFDDSTC
jgi:bifunctional oligoribonuclease and PAP phosphatase NrnA